MKLRKTLAAAGALAIAGGAFAMQPSQAATDSTTVTFQITGGALTIDAPLSDTLANGTALSLLGGTQTVSGTLNTTTVTDARTGSAGFGVIMSSSSFDTTGATTSTADDFSIPATAVSAGTPSLGTITGIASNLVTSGTVVVVAPDSNLGASDGTDKVVTVVAPAGTLFGSYSVAYDVDVSVAVPSDAMAGTYTGTITQVAS